MQSKKPYILSLDQGTTSSRALLIDQNGQLKAMAQREFKQIYPQPGWVEHDPNEIWKTQFEVAQEVLRKMEPHAVATTVGITNQRETTVVWNRKTGLPVYNAIVWQDRRTADFCEKLKEQGYSKIIQEKTGLVIDAYFSASKLRWILDHVPGAREQAKRGDLAFGTIDAWLIWKLTAGKIHATDVSNASRTMLFNIQTCDWDKDLLDLFEIPRSMLPEIKASSENYGLIDPELFQLNAVSISGVAGDQQAALFGQLCLEPGMLKNTYGTGCFLMLNIGSTPILSKNKLLTTVAWKIGNQVTYALEGSVFIGGAVVQWLRDGLQLIESSTDIEALAAQAEDNGGVYFVPAFTGLGAPHWDPYARGTILGLTRGSGRHHVARAALEAIAYQTRDVADAMRSDAGIKLRELRVDGGASANNLLMQFQSDILGSSVIRPQCLESTAMGAAYLAGLASQLFESPEALQRHWQQGVHYKPTMPENQRNKLYQKWQKAVQYASGWDKQ